MSETYILLHIVTNVNQYGAKAFGINRLEYCINFNQTR